MRTISALIADAHEVLNDARTLYNPARMFALFSGGYDSLCSAHVASQHPAFEGCAHIITGIGVEETREYVRETCKRFNWPLREYRPPVSYDEIVLKYGFPGPDAHRFMYTRLKERCLEQLMRDCRMEDNNFKRGYFLQLVTGVRKQESSRRMGTVHPHSKQRTRIWCAPIHDWTAFDINRYRAHFGLPENPVREELGMSGECLCGAFAKPNEIAEIEYWYPATAQRIHDLEEKAEAAGVPCVWGVAPPKPFAQGDAPALFEMPLCSSCAFRQERRLFVPSQPEPELQPPAVQMELIA